MEYLKLGKTGISVSRICFGCAPMGGHDYGDVLDSDSEAAVHCAIEHGINFFDVAAIYGFGRAEEVLGKALKGKRDKVVIATKGGLRKTAAKIVPDLRPEYIAGEIEGSLKRLGTDYIDLYQLHYYDPAVPFIATAEVLRKSLEQGKIRAVGLSNFSKSQVAEFASLIPVSCLQLPYNPLQRALEVQGIPEFCANNNVGLITYSSLARGYLSGKKYSGQDFHGSDTRQRSTYFSPETETMRQPVLDVVAHIAAQKGKTPGHVALRWLMDKPFLTSAIVGFKTAVQVMDVLAACDWKLAPEDILRIDAVSCRFQSQPLY